MEHLRRSQLHSRNVDRGAIQQGLPHTVTLELLDGGRLTE